MTNNYVLPGFAMKAAYGSLVVAVLVFISMLLLTGIHHSLVFSNAAIVVALTRLAKAIFEGGGGARGGGWGAVI